jgi:excisionase family DNA binding protein
VLGDGRRFTVDSYLTMPEAAERIGMSVRFVRRLVARREIPFHKLGRSVRLAESDLAAFVAAGCVEPITHVDGELAPVAWELARPDDPDVPPLQHRLLRAISQRIEHRRQIADARQRAGSDAPPTVAAISTSTEEGR